MKTTQEKIAVMQAYLDGKSIEFSLDGESYRPVLVEPEFDWRLLDYRVKPTIREGWVNLYNSGFNLSAGNIYDTREQAIKYIPNAAVKTVKIAWEE